MAYSRASDAFIFSEGITLAIWIDLCDRPRVFRTDAETANICLLFRLPQREKVDDDISDAEPPFFVKQFAVGENKSKYRIQFVIFVSTPLFSHQTVLNALICSEAALFVLVCNLRPFGTVARLSTASASQSWYDVLAQSWTSAHCTHLRHRHQLSDLNRRKPIGVLVLSRVFADASAATKDRRRVPVVGWAHRWERHSAGNVVNEPHKNEKKPAWFGLRYILPVLVVAAIITRTISTP